MGRRLFMPYPGLTFHYMWILPVIIYALAYWTLLEVIGLLKKRYPDNPIILFFKSYGGILLVICLMILLVKLRFQFTAFSVVIFGFISLAFIEVWLKKIRRK